MNYVGIRRSRTHESTDNALKGLENLAGEIQALERKWDASMLLIKCVLCFIRIYSRYKWETTILLYDNKKARKRFIYIVEKKLVPTKNREIYYLGLVWDPGEKKRKRFDRVVIARALNFLQNPSALTNEDLPRAFQAPLFHLFFFFPPVGFSSHFSFVFRGFITSNEPPMGRDSTTTQCTMSTWMDRTWIFTWKR